jgi:isoquinoline 1-oxidoreductase beta subunit
MNAFVDLSRREFLKNSALAAGGLVIAFTVPGAKRFAMAQAPAASLPPPNAFLRVGADDQVTVLIAHSERGRVSGRHCLC